ncbi:MAG: DUF4215 domain-containing protein [Nannocystaceae bacterium]
MQNARKPLFLAFVLLAACGPQDGNDETGVVLTTSTGDMSTGDMTGMTTAVSTVTGVPTSTSSSTSSTTDDTSTDTDDTSSSSSTTEDPAVCGDGVQEGAEECDDANDDDEDDCTNACLLPVCGDGTLYKGVEQCDDGNDVDEDECPTTCEDAKCGDGFVYEGFEECDDGNDDDTDACVSTCAMATCGDGFIHDGVELCDDGENMGEYDGCAAGCKALGPHCGDGSVQKSQGERCDSNPPLAGLTCKNNCTINFALATQMYCHNACTWDATAGCGQGDADIFCKLKLGSSSAKATKFIVNKATDGYGFPCGNPDAFIPNDTRMNLGTMPEYGVNQPVLWQEKDIYSSGQKGDALVSVTCTM